MLLHGFAELSIGEQGQGFAAPGSISSASDLQTGHVAIANF